MVNIPLEINDAPEETPEEGREGWICVLGSFFSLFCTFGFLNAIGVFQTTYQATTLKQYTSSEISWIFAVQLALMWAPGSLFGRIVDTYGPEPVMYPCSVLCVFSLCMTSLSTKYYQIFLAQGIGFGVGAGGIFTTAMVCVGQWFVRRRGLAVGIASSGSSLGGVVFPFFFDKLTAQVGLPTSMRYAALMIGSILTLSCFLVKARLPRKRWNSNVRWFDFKLLKEAPFGLYAFGSFFVMWGLWSPFDYLPGMAEHIGFSRSNALYLISIINASSIPGRIIPSHFGDRVGHFNMITIVAFLTGLFMACLWVPFDYHHIHAGIITFALLYGFVSGAYISLMIPCAAKASDIERIGQRVGTYQTTVAMSCLTGLPIMGAILAKQNNDNYLGLQIFATGSVFVGTAMTAVSTSLNSRMVKSGDV